MQYIRREQVAVMNHHYHYYTLDYFLKAQKELGMKTIEFWAGSPHIWMDHYCAYDVNKVKDKIASYDFHIGCVTPENTAYMYQVAGWEEEQKDRAFKYFSNGIHLTAELGCDRMGINCGWGYLGEDKKEGYKRSTEMLSRLAQVAEREGILLMAETTPRGFGNVVCTLEDLKELISTVGNKALKPMLNTTAMSCAGETMEDWFEAFGNDIEHIHFVDGMPEGQLIWGDGIHDLAEWISVLNRYGYDKYLGQDITDGRYIEHPEFYDKRSIRNLERYMRPED